jgi:indole-3-glycerol phosphate synthase
MQTSTLRVVTPVTPGFWSVREDPPRADARLLERLEDLLRRLQLIMAVIHTSASALRHQNADSDAEIAAVLERHAADRLSVEIEQLETLIGRLRAGAHDPDAQDNVSTP